MAVLSMLAGGLVGFFSAIVGLLVWDISWLNALGVWTGFGALFGIVVLILTLLPHKALPQPDGNVMGTKTA